jgi:hypothetical protein
LELHYSCLWCNSGSGSVRLCSMQVCEDYFRRDSGAMGSLPRLLAWAASVVQYRSLSLCHTMGILLGLIQPGRVGSASYGECRGKGLGRDGKPAIGSVKGSAAQ